MQEDTNCSQGEKKKKKGGESAEQIFIFTIHPPYLLVNIYSVKLFRLERGIQNAF